MHPIWVGNGVLADSSDLRRCRVQGMRGIIGVPMTIVDIEKAYLVGNFELRFADICAVNLLLKACSGLKNSFKTRP
jgi:hypothetical protein